MGPRYQDKYGFGVQWIAANRFFVAEASKYQTDAPALKENPMETSAFARVVGTMIAAARKSVPMTAFLNAVMICLRRVKLLRPTSAWRLHLQNAEP